MNLFELFVKVGVDDQASGRLGEIGQKLGNGLKTAAKIGTAAVGAAAAGITALTTAAVNNYAEYEQLVGGVETLFGKSADTVMKYAENAYKTAGLSANEYMATVTSFSASLLQSVGGDTDKAADYANRALTDMSDNANKMGTSMELIQNAYNGFAKANYTMLDNLKLGYGGTGEEMKRLIADAAALTDVQKELGITVDATDMSFGNIVNAISVVQKNMKITGTTADEAGRTIAGSAQSMKSAWTNLVTGFADGNADIESLIEDLVGTIVGDGTENNLGFIGNVLPAIETALGGVVKLIEGAAPKIIEILPGLVAQIVPSLISAATSLVGSLVAVFPSLLQSVLTALTNQSSQIIQTVLDVFLDVGKSLVENAPLLIDATTQIIDELIWWVGEYSYVFGETAVDLIEALTSGIVSNLPMLFETALVTIEYFAETLTEMFPQIVSLGLDLMFSLAKGLSENIPELVPVAIDAVLKLTETLTDPTTLSNLMNAALVLIKELAFSLIEAIPQLVDSAIKIIENLVVFLTDEETLKNLLNAAVDIILTLVNSILNNLDPLLDAAIGAIEALIMFLLDPEVLGRLAAAALDIIFALAAGLVSSVWKLVEAANELGESIGEKLKSMDWKQWGEDLMDSLLDGIKAAWESISGWFSDAWGSIKSLFSGADDAVAKTDKAVTEANAKIVEANNKVSSFTDSLKNTAFNVPVNSYQQMGVLGNTNTQPPVNITQNIYTSQMSPAEAMQEARYRQELSLIN